MDTATKRAEAKRRAEVGRQIRAELAVYAYCESARGGDYGADANRNAADLEWRSVRSSPDGALGFKL